MSYLSTILSDSPAIVYKLNETSGVTVTDYSGNGDTGTIVGTVGYQVPGPVLEVPFGMDLNTSGVFIKNTATLNFAIATVEVWMNAATPGADSQIVGFVQGDNDGISDKDLFQTAGGKFRGYAFDGTGVTTFDSTPDIGDGQWHLLHLVADGSDLIPYVDAEQTGPPAACGPTFAGYAAGQPSIQLGGSQTGHVAVWQEQKLAWFAVYPSALSAARVAAHYDAAFLPDLTNSVPPIIGGRGAC